MENFVYVIGCTEICECVLVDLVWVVDGLFEQLDNDDMMLVGVLIIYYYLDYCGGFMMGFSVEGLLEFMVKCLVFVYVNEYEVDGIKKVMGLSDSDFKIQSLGDCLVVGMMEVIFFYMLGYMLGS